jgi:hypothetical protein
VVERLTSSFRGRHSFEHVQCRDRTGFWFWGEYRLFLND